MRRSLILALFATLALAIGFSASAAAVEDGADASAKKGKKCKKGKGKAKARTSSAAISLKKKGKGCKKGKGKSPAGGPGSTTKNPPATPTTPTLPPPAATWPPADGKYNDTGTNGLLLTIKAGGTQASAVLGGDDTCIGTLSFPSPDAPAQSTPTTFSASSEPFSYFGKAGTAKWSIAVTTDLQYTLTIDSSLAFAETTPCDKPGVVHKGTLVKAP